MNHHLNVVAITKSPMLSQHLDNHLKSNNSIQYSQHEDTCQLHTISSADVIFFELSKSTEALTILRIYELSKSVPIVLISSEDSDAKVAYEIGAIDFLPCNFNHQRLLKCFSKLGLHLFDSEPKSQEEVREKQPSDKLVVKDVGKVRLIRIQDILWIKGAGNYVEIHLLNGQAPILHRETIKNLEQTLKAHNFVRIHRSTLVRTSDINEISRTDNGDYTVTLTNKQQLILSRRYKDCLHQIYKTAAI